MSDRTEAEFAAIVGGWLAEAFVDVKAEVTLTSGRRVDFLAYTPFESYVIEVEDGADSLYNAIGQAAVYAEETGHQPVAIFPVDDAPDPAEIPDWLCVVRL